MFPAEYSRHKTCKAFLVCLESNKKGDDQKKEDKEEGEDSGINRGHVHLICRKIEKGKQRFQIMLANKLAMDKRIYKNMPDLLRPKPVELLAAKCKINIDYS